MARMIGVLAGVLLLILVSLPASAQNSPATQVNCDSGQSIQTTVDSTLRAGGSTYRAPVPKRSRLSPTGSASSPKPVR